MNEHLSLARSYEEVGRQLYRRYASRPLSEHIASAHAIAGLARWLTARAPGEVVELGAGIGTLTECLLRYGSLLDQPPRIDSVEAYEPCREQLVKNLQQALEETRCRFALHRDVEVALADRQIDFLVVDGGDEHAMSCIRQLRRSGTVFVEGDRRPQRDAILRFADGRSVAAHQFISARLRHPQPVDARSPTFEGGYSILRFDPSIRVRLEFFAYRAHSSWLRRVVRPRVVRAATNGGLS